MRVIASAQVQDVASPDGTRSPQVFIERFTVMPSKLCCEMEHHDWIRFSEGGGKLAIVANIGADEEVLARMASVAAPNYVATLAQLLNEWLTERS